jgi:protoheme IX farnesyltransferase
MTMATEPIVPAFEVAVPKRRRFAGSTVLFDYLALTKPEINFLIGFTTAAAFCMASPDPSDFRWALLLHTLLGTMLVASGAATLNQVIELRSDAQMRRTARRPIAAGRIEPIRALIFGTVLSLVGVAYLVVAVNILVSALALATLLSYLFLYTPFKRITPLCTLIGAVPGAVPPLIGWAAARGRLSPEAWMLYAILFLWQFPHFMAIAWMYRDDYDRAGYLVLPHGRMRNRFVVLQTLLPLSILVVVSLHPAFPGNANIFHFIGASILSLGFFCYGARFALRLSGPAARQLLMASIVYLPSLLVLMVLSKN